jgi:UPF0755 protein
MIKIPELRKLILENKTEVILGVVFIFLCFWVFIATPPSSFQKDVLVEIPEGSTLKEVSKILKDQRIIRSRGVFSVLLIIQGKDDNIMAGDYHFKTMQNIFEVSKKITTGDYGIELRKITLKEGLTTWQMANLLEDQYEKFDEELFLELVKGKEGYLFPDTYFFPENVKTREIVDTLTDNFEDKILSIEKELSDSPYELDDIIIMASIVEKEATAESRELVANILWNRLEIGMALQVDAPFVFERGKGSFDLSIADLREDSLYNTYTNPGLTPGPIANPGLESILAAANPEPTDYIFFLTGMDGEMYYAETFEQHKENKRLYLN